MRFFGIAALALGLCTVQARADEEREALARQIEALSETYEPFDTTSSFFISGSVRQYMVADACTIAAETTASGPDGEEIYGVTFDLEHAILPDPDEREGGGIGFVKSVDGPEMTGTFQVQFAAPHGAVPYGNPVGLVRPDRMDVFNFWMDPVIDEERLYELARLLHRYRDGYCTPPG